MANILLTGGCGYIGSVLVPKLLEAGHTVRVIDLQWFGNYLKPHPRLDVIKCDIRDDSFPIGADAIIHLAGLVGPDVERHPWSSIQINLLGTVTVPLGRVFQRAWQQDQNPDRSFAHTTG